MGLFAGSYRPAARINPHRITNSVLFADVSGVKQIVSGPGERAKNSGSSNSSAGSKSHAFLDLEPGLVCEPQ